MSKRRLSFDFDSVDTSTPLLKSKKARSILKEIFVANIPKDVSFHDDDDDSIHEAKKIKQEEIVIVRKLLSSATPASNIMLAKTPQPVTPSTMKLLYEMFQKSTKAIEKRKPIRSIRF
jgi:hypothetical protein